MIDLKILAARGITPRRLREIFTSDATANPEDFKTREALQKLISSRLADGVKWGLRTSSIYQAVDIAWDSQPVQKETIPLMMYAMGKIDAGSFTSQVKDLKVANEFCTFNKDGTVKELDIPRFYETQFNLLRSYTTRRHASQSSRYSNTWPYFRYEPKSTTLVGKLRGDVMSQYADQMADNYNYRHFMSQCDRDCFLYGHSVAFPLQAWDRKVQWRGKPLNTAEGTDVPYEVKVTSEGVDFTNPHPSRTFWDRASPLANINTNTGPKWIGYWDMVRYSSVKDNDTFFNMSEVSSSSYIGALLAEYKNYFSYYYSDPTVMTVPQPRDANDRIGTAASYASEDEDMGVLLSTIFMELVPKKVGLGDYPFPVWFRFVVASDDTVVFVEPMPSLPAAYSGINEHDGRAVNISPAHELMPYQDQLTQILSNLAMRVKQSHLQIWLIDKDALEPKVKKYIEDTVQSKNYFVDPMIMFYSGTKIKDLGLDPTQMIKIIRSDMQAEITGAFDSIMKLLSVVDRLIVASPNELGQPNPREVAAREVQEIATSVSTIGTFISDGLDEQRVAVKRIIYESAVICATQDICVPVIGRYTKATIEAAGFKLFEERTGSADGDSANRVTVTGSPDQLEYAFYFSSRDGAERASNTQSAQVLTQLAQFILAAPGIAQAIGKERLFELFNEIFRLSGAAFDLKLEIDDGEANGLPSPQDAGNTSQQQGQAGGAPPWIAALQPILAQLQQRLTTLEQATGATTQPETDRAALAVRDPNQ